MKTNVKKDVKIQANIQEAKTLLGTIAEKSAERDALISQIRELDSRVSQLKKENMMLGGYAATNGMRPKQKTLAKVLQRIMKPGKKVTIAEAEKAVLASGYQTKNTSWFRATIGKELRNIKGVHKVMNKRATYVLAAPKKKAHTGHSVQAA